MRSGEGHGIRDREREQRGREVAEFRDLRVVPSVQLIQDEE